jgi:hypothetical protein
MRFNIQRKNNKKLYCYELFGLWLTIFFIIIFADLKVMNTKFRNRLKRYDNASSIVSGLVTVQLIGMSL